MKVLATISAVLLISVLVAGETEFCRNERQKCGDRCNGFEVHFDCQDHNGARAVSCSCGEALQGAEAAGAHPSGGSPSSTSHGNGGSFAVVELQICFNMPQDSLCTALDFLPEVLPQPRRDGPADRMTGLRWQI